MKRPSTRSSCRLRVHFTTIVHFGCVGQLRGLDTLWVCSSDMSYTQIHRQRDVEASGETQAHLTVTISTESVPLCRCVCVLRVYLSQNGSQMTLSPPCTCVLMLMEQQATGQHADGSRSYSPVCIPNKEEEQALYIQVE